MRAPLDSGVGGLQVLPTPFEGVQLRAPRLYSRVKNVGPSPAPRLGSVHGQVREPYLALPSPL